MTMTFTTSDRLQHIHFLHRDTDGYVCIFKKDATTRKPKPRMFKLSDLTDAALDAFTSPNDDVYVSMNSFYIPKRTIKQLRTIHTFYIDIDCYHLDANNIEYARAKVLYLLQTEYFGKLIPMPNMIVFSGRGLQLVWLIEPISGLAVHKWNELQHTLYDILKPLGADSQALDAARVLRLSGTRHSKANVQVTSEIIHEQPYDFYDMCREYYPHLSFLQPRVERKKERGNRKAPVMRLTAEGLYAKRLHDLEMLVQLRQGKCKGHREYILFLYRYYALRLKHDYVQAYKMTAQLNAQFTEPMEESNWSVSTKSAEGYYKDGNFRITNQKLIDWLSITEDEQQHLETIISRNEKNRRKRAYMTAKRRAAGVKPIAEYKAARSKQVQRQCKRLYILRLLKPKASLATYARLLNISKTTVHRLLQQVKKSFRDMCPCIDVSVFTKVLKRKEVKKNVLNWCRAGQFNTFDEWLRSITKRE